jgi:hypothetical protein
MTDAQADARAQVLLEVLDRIANRAVRAWALGARGSLVGCSWDRQTGFYEVEVKVWLPWWARRLFWEDFVRAVISLQWVRVAGEDSPPMVVRFELLT